MKVKENKKPIIALLLVALIGVIGTTIAYFTTTDTFSNVFSTKPYSVSVVETFISPDDWTPGTTTDKTIKATNTGDVDIAVRVSYTESWKDLNNNTLPLETDGIRASLINFATGYTTNWTKTTENSKEYYYYNTALAKNDYTTNLIESVTFNPEIEGTINSNCTTEEGTKTCTTSVSGYAGGTYTLVITVETVQYSQYQAAWGTNISIAEAS